MAEDKDKAKNDKHKDKAPTAKAKPADKAEAKTEKKAAPKAQAAASDKPSKPKEKKAKAPGASAKRAPLNRGTKLAKDGEYPGRWHLIDATNLTLGRLSSYVATVLMGKHNPYYTPFSDTGDHVIVVNAEKVRLTGRKMEQKEYNYHTNYPGGIKTFKVADLLKTHPDRVIQWAVWGMLPKSKGHMVRHWYKKLKVYAGPNHPHTAQKPQPAKLPNLGMNAE